MCLSILLATCLLALMPCSDVVSAQEKVAVNEIVVVSPPDGAFVTEKTVFLAGHVVGGKVESVMITGVGAKAARGKVAVTDNTFGPMITLKQGVNVLNISGGGVNKQIKIFYTAADKVGKGFKPPKGFKRFYIHERSGR